MDNEGKPREFWIVPEDDNYYRAVWEHTPKAPMDHMLHVIEYSAYEKMHSAMMGMVDKSKEQHDENQKLLARVQALREALEKQMCLCQPVNRICDRCKALAQDAEEK